MVTKCLIYWYASGRPK